MHELGIIVALANKYYQMLGSNVKDKWRVSNVGVVIAGPLELCRCGECQF